MTFPAIRVRTARTMDSDRSTPQPCICHLLLGPLKVLLMAVRGLHGKPVVHVFKRRPFCLEGKDAFGQDPELQWPHTHTPLHCFFPTVAHTVQLQLTAWSEHESRSWPWLTGGLGPRVSPEPQQHKHPFWIGSHHGQGSYTTCCGQSVGAPGTSVSLERPQSGGDMGLMGTSQSSVFPWGQQDMELRVIARWHRLRSFLAPKLHQPEK